MTQVEVSKVASRSTSKGRPPYQQYYSARKPRLLEQLRQALRSRHYSRRTEQTNCKWVKRFIYFHKVRHPVEMAEPEINALRTHLAVKGQVRQTRQSMRSSRVKFGILLMANIGLKVDAAEAWLLSPFAVWLNIH